MENETELPKSDPEIVSPSAWSENDVTSCKSPSDSRPYTLTPVVSMAKIDVEKESIQSVQSVQEKQKEKKDGCFKTFKSGIKCKFTV
jgi:hypothetical protein